MTMTGVGLPFCLKIEFSKLWDWVRDHPSTLRQDTYLRISTYSTVGLPSTGSLARAFEVD